MDFFQQLAGLFDAYLLQIIAEAHAHVSGKHQADVGEAVIDVLADFGKRDLARVVCNHVIFNEADNIRIVVVRNFVPHQVNHHAGKKGAQYLGTLAQVVALLAKHLLYQEKE